MGDDPRRYVKTYSCSEEVDESDLVSVMATVSQ